MAKSVEYVCQNKVSLLFAIITSPGIILSDSSVNDKREWQNISVQDILILCSLFDSSSLLFSCFHYNSQKSTISKKEMFTNWSSDSELLILLYFVVIGFWNFKRLSSTAGAIQEAKYDSLYGYNLTDSGSISHRLLPLDWSVLNMSSESAIL